MDRRDLLILLGCCTSFAARASAAEKNAKIGFLSWFPPNSTADLDHFRQGMKQLGYTEGQDYRIEPHLIGGDAVAARDAATKMVAEPVDILVAVATPTIHIAKQATQTIPS